MKRLRHRSLIKASARGRDTRVQFPFDLLETECSARGHFAAMAAQWGDFLATGE